MTIIQTNANTEDIYNVILNKFEQYIKNKKKAPAIDKLVKKEIEKIESMEDSLSSLPNIEDYIGDDNIIYFGQYSFKYDKNTEMFKYTLYGSTLEEAVRERIYNSERLYVSWAQKSMLQTRIRAIVSLFKGISNEDARELVEKQIDFDEVFNVKDYSSIYNDELKYM